MLGKAVIVILISLWMSDGFASESRYLDQVVTAETPYVNIIDYKFSDVEVNRIAAPELAGLVESGLYNFGILNSKCISFGGAPSLSVDGGSVGREIAEDTPFSGWLRNQMREQEALESRQTDVIQNWERLLVQWNKLVAVVKKRVKLRIFHRSLDSSVVDASNNSNQVAPSENGTGVAMVLALQQKSLSENAGIDDGSIDIGQGLVRKMDEFTRLISLPVNGPRTNLASACGYLEMYEGILAAYHDLAVSLVQFKEEEIRY